MVIPNFFITFVRHSFHTSHPLHIPSRERRHRPAPPCHQTLHFPHAHALPHALSARDCLTRCTSQGLCHTRHTHATHPRPPCYHPLAKSYAHAPHTRYASSPSQHTRPQRAMPRTLLLMRLKRPSHYPPLLSEKKARAP